MDFSLAADDLHGQTSAAMRNLKTAMDAAGVGWDDIVRRTIYTMQPTEYETITKAIDEVTGGADHPAQTIVGITGLAVRGCLIEIECTAVVLLSQPTTRRHRQRGQLPRVCRAARARRLGCVRARTERRFGGAVQDGEITEPGYVHDVFSAWHPLWVGGPAHAQLGADLARHGLDYLNTDAPDGDLYPDGEARSSCARQTRTPTSSTVTTRRRRRLAGNARRVLPERRSRVRRSRYGALVKAGLGLGVKAFRRLGRRGAAEFAGRLLISARDWLETTFGSERAHGLLAPWVLHTGLGPDAAASGYMAKVIAVAVQEGGMPIPRGGGAAARRRSCRADPGQRRTCETGVHVEQVFRTAPRSASACGRRDHLAPRRSSAT